MVVFIPLENLQTGTLGNSEKKSKEVLRIYRNSGQKLKVLYDALIVRDSTIFWGRTCNPHYFFSQMAVGFLQF